MLPSGTLSFLFTDIEGSTRLWETQPESMRAALAEHDEIMRRAVAAHSGLVFKTIGDAFCAVFPTPSSAAAGAVQAQTAIADLSERTLPLKVRIAIQTGQAELRDADYFGPPLNRVARMLAIAHGGQVLLSESSFSQLDGSFECRSLGLHRLKDIAEPAVVYQLLHRNLPDNFPPLRSLSITGTPNNLPSMATSFVGRDKELGEISSLLDRSRLLTLHGTGGCGKTRFALELAEMHLDDFPDGVWLVEQAAFCDAPLIAESLGNLLGIKADSTGEITSLISKHLADQRVMLVFDNAEHLIGPCAALVTHLLRACPNLKVVVTSRQVLNVQGEQTYRVPSLDMPDPKRHQPAAKIAEYGSVRLFVERARLVKPDFAVTEDNALTVAQLCARLDGMPLAIELAAARLKSLSIGDIASRLDNRFRLLTGGNRAGLPRQQTLKALVDWSYDLLTAQEILLFQRLSVFSGTWTLEAAEYIVSGEDENGTSIEDWEVLDLLASLIDKSLLVTLEAGEKIRYRMLETMRQYASDRREERGGLLDVQRRHRDYYLLFVESANSEISTGRQAEALSAIEAEHDNLRVALDFCLRDPESSGVGLRLAGAMNRFWRTRGYLREAQAFLDSVLALPSEEPSAKAEALFGAGLIGWMRGDYDAAARYQSQALELRRELGDPQGEANSLGSLAYIAHGRADYKQARELFRESMEIRKRLGDKQGVANSLGGLGMVAFLLDELEEARNLHSESLQLRRELGDKEGQAVALMNLGGVSTKLSELNAGRTQFQEALHLVRELGDRRLGAFALEALASLEDIGGNLETSATLYGAAQALREAIGSPQPANEAAEYEKTLEDLSQRLGPDRYERALREGRRMDLDEATAFGLSVHEETVVS